MTPQANTARREVNAIKVHQWLREWDSVKYDQKQHRKRPEPHFYLFAMPAAELKALSGIHRRTTAAGRPRSEDLGIQRRHDEGRSEEIGRFVRFGYPWSNLNKRQREQGEFRALRKPGWLPTAIVVNILGPHDDRRGETVAQSDLITVKPGAQNLAKILLPVGFADADWRPSSLHPIEVIDGQHRLWAFESSDDAPESYELPVVAFYGLDLSWQAYLFWTINIKPKRINPSLAFDLYPLLRTEDWLEKFEGPAVYRETRAQELTEVMWSHSRSPWFHRINMLGEAGTGMVSQAGWIRSLLATYIRSFGGQGISIGGLFGAPVGVDQLVLPWSRAQQGAFLIAVWEKIRDAIAASTANWTRSLRANVEGGKDLAFFGPYTLLNQDQGLRAVLHITNDVAFVRHEELKLRQWEIDSESEDELKVVSAALDSMPKPITAFLTEIAEALATFDWRSANADDLSESERITKLVYRGSGGYTEFRRQLLIHVSKATGQAGRAAKLVLRDERSS